MEDQRKETDRERLDEEERQPGGIETKGMAAGERQGDERNSSDANLGLEENPPQTISDYLRRARQVPGIFLRVYMMVVKENPLLAIIGTAGILYIAPIPWGDLYQQGVEWMQQLRGWLGV